MTDPIDRAEQEINRQTTPAERLAICVLSIEGEYNAPELAKIVGVSAPHMYDYMEALEAAGVVESDSENYNRTFQF